MRIGLPLDGWDLAVVDAAGQPVPQGTVGELIIGGVGLARYLDPDKDAEKYAPMPSLGWTRAYRSGDLVRDDGQGLVFEGRADDQVKLGGRRIELGEVDSALLRLPGVRGAAAAVRRTKAGNALLVGYVQVDATFDASTALVRLRESLPAALVPRVATVGPCPPRPRERWTGTPSRGRCPTSRAAAGGHADLSGTAAWVAELWADVIGATARSGDDDFFDLGGGSLTAAQIVSRLRSRYPETTVADIYEHPTLAELADALDAMAAPTSRTNREVGPTPTKTQVGQLAFTLPLRTITGLRWLTWVAVGNNLAVDLLGSPTSSRCHGLWSSSDGCCSSRPRAAWASPSSVPASCCGGCARAPTRAAAASTCGCGWPNVSPTSAAQSTSPGHPSSSYYARALGAQVGRDVDLHSVPPVTGFLTLGDGCSVEPEVDLTGHWLDGDVLHIGSVDVGAGARIGTRSTLGPDARVGRDAEVAPGSAVHGASRSRSSGPGLPQSVSPTPAGRGPRSARRGARVVRRRTPPRLSASRRCPSSPSPAACSSCSRR